MRSIQASIVLWAALCAAGSARAQPPLDNIVLSEREAFALLAPELIAAPLVREASWSPDGKYVLLVRESARVTLQMVQTALRSGSPPVGPPPGEASIALWSSTTQRTVDLWKRPAGQASVERVVWLPGTAFALATVVERPAPDPSTGGKPVPTRMLLRISAATAAVRIVAQQAEGDAFRVVVSPRQPVVIVHREITLDRTVTEPDGSVRQVSDGATELRAMLPSGALGPPTVLTRDSPLMDFAWSPDGVTPYLRCHDREGTVRAKRFVERWLRYDTRAGRLSPVAQGPEPPRSTEADRPEAESLRLRRSTVALKEGETSRTLQPLWLEAATTSERPRALISPDCSAPQLAPAGDGILYISQGAAWVVPIVRMSREEYGRLRAQSERMAAISRAKQAGLAALMYAEDYDYILPGPDGIADRLRPYLRDREALSALVYTYPGGPLNGIADPSQTELGYVNGPGGKAVIYADGHVSWRAD